MHFEGTKTEGKLISHTIFFFFLGARTNVPVCFRFSRCRMLAKMIFELRRHFHSFNVTLKQYNCNCLFFHNKRNCSMKSQGWQAQSGHLRSKKFVYSVAEKGLLLRHPQRELQVLAHASTAQMRNNKQQERAVETQSISRLQSPSVTRAGHKASQELDIHAFALTFFFLFGSV